MDDERLYRMKSMLYEASSVMKAIEKAWAESGHPSEFTVKVLEREEKNFFGFTKKPAVVSIAYDPRKQQLEKNNERSRDKKASSGRNDRSNDTRDTRSDSRSDNRNDRPLRQNSFDKDGSMSRKDGHVSHNTKQNQQNAQPQQAQRHRFVESEPVKQPEKTQSDMIEGWTPELVDQVVVWMKEMLAIMGIQSKATTKIDRKALMVNFDNVLLDSPEDERLLFINMSFALIQFLKKKHKKKFRGFHIIIQSRTPVTHDKNS